MSFFNPKIYFMKRLVVLKLALIVSSLLMVNLLLNAQVVSTPKPAKSPVKPAKAQKVQQMGCQKLPLKLSLQH
jgi:hypothetical protein